MNATQQRSSRMAARTFIVILVAFALGIVGGIAIERFLLAPRVTAKETLKDRLIGRWIVEGLYGVEFLPDGTFERLTDYQMEGKPRQPPRRELGQYTWLDAEHIEMKQQGGTTFTSRVVVSGDQLKLLIVKGDGAVVPDAILLGTRWREDVHGPWFPGNKRSQDPFYLE